jgi:hypothetical protein
VQELERLVNKMNCHMRLQVQTCTRKGATGGGYATQRGRKPQGSREMGRLDAGEKFDVVRETNEALAPFLERPCIEVD